MYKGKGSRTYAVGSFYLHVAHSLTLNALFRPRQAQPPSSSTGATKAPKTTSATAASSSSTLDTGADPWKNRPLPSIAGGSEWQVMDPKTLLECCKCTRAFNQEHELPVGSGAVGVTLMRTIEYRNMILQELAELCDPAKEKNWGEFLLELVDVLYLVCNLTQEAGLETVLSAAFSLKYAANMKKSFSTQKEALDNAAAMKCVLK